MGSIAFALPRTDDASDHSRELVEALTHGDAGETVHNIRKQAGFERVKVWQQDSPPTTIVYLEAPDVEAAIQSIASDDHEHNQWVLDKISKIIGRNPSDDSGRPNTRLVMDWHHEKGHSATHH